MADFQKVELRSKRTGRVTGVRYRVQWRDVTGRQVVRQVKTEREARDILAQVAHDRVAGTLADTKAGRQTLQDLYDEVHAIRRYSAATTSMHSTAWKHVPASVRSAAISKIDVGTIDRVLAKVAAPAMNSKLRSILSGLFEHAIAKRRITVNPAKRHGFRKTRAEEIDSESAAKRVLEDGELVRLVDAIPERYRALIQIMAAVGLRPSEALALRVGDFDPTDSTLRIAGTKTATARRVVVLPKQIADVLEAHNRRFTDRNPGSLVFTTDAGTAIDLHNFRARVFATAAKRAGVNHGLKLYDLRHTAASRAIRNGAPLPAIAAMLGHKDATITLRVYAHEFDDDQRRLADLLDRSLDTAWIDVPERVS
ncbi:MAG: tyrosine-type recombinase/integrase [Actinomycetota bacterium]